jgi:predicted Zn-dependent protease
MDYHFLKQDYPKTAKAVDQLDQQVGGDPYLNLIRANIAIGQNDAEAARGFVETLIKALPDKATEGYGILLDQAIEAQNHAETTRVLKALEAETPVRFPIDFNKAKPFADYMASPEYEKWKAYKNEAKQPE